MTGAFLIYRRRIKIAAYQGQPAPPGAPPLIRNPSTKVFLFSESIARDWFLASFSIRQLKQTVILLNSGLSPEKKFDISRRDPSRGIIRYFPRPEGAQSHSLGQSERSECRPRTSEAINETPSDNFRKNPGQNRGGIARFYGMMGLFKLSSSH